MIIRYFGFGKRWYGEAPLAPGTRRAVWEFQAVLHGKIAPSREAGKDSDFHGSKMWVFAPGVAHGWSAPRGRAAEIVVFHFAEVPYPVARFCKPTGEVSFSLTSSECSRLRCLANRLQQAMRELSPAQGIFEEHLLWELACLVVENFSDRVEGEIASEKKRRVERSMHWFRGNLAEGCGLAEVCRELHVSQAQLRRDFHEIVGSAPSAVFERIRMDRAMELLAGSNSTLEEIAEQCGYSDASAFSRAFRKTNLVPPGIWRKTIGRGSPE